MTQAAAEISDRRRWTFRPAFWIAFAALSVLGLAVAWRFFPLAIPLVNLDITMSRAEALEKADAIAARLALAPAEARSAVRFAHDSATQNYVELEGGGRAAFAELVKGTVYAPYWWDVRIFRPGEVSEVTIRFRPEGASNGFARRVAESYVRDAATKALSAEAARTLAEERATVDWQVDLKPYALLEQSQQTRPNGRIDHAFVYQRPDPLGEAQVRLRLAVTGDELTEVTPDVHVPEAFERRFRELRSANDTIAGVAGLTAGLLYGLGGCIFAVLWLARQHWLAVRPALAAGFIVGGLMAATTLSAAPTAWFDFDTAQSVTTFWLRQAGAVAAVAIGGGMGYALVFMAAESLTRRAFPHQPQLWRVWSAAGGASREVLGRTLGGYAFVPIELALIACFYYATNRWLGWWQPSESLTDPNILSYAVPALMPIAVSLQAGFMEECLFRAVPLALGALIGARFGRRRAGIAVAFVLQALVFGGAHANYPGFPSYSRLVELVLPSMLWAAIFLRFGLLPTILLHALYDLTLFSIPLFLVDAPGATTQRLLVIAAALVPLAIVLWRRARAGAWRDLPSAIANRAWTPRVVAPVIAPGRRATADSRGQHVAQRSLPYVGLAGLVAWLVFTPMRADVPTMALDRSAAEAAADAALKARGVVIGPEWRRMSIVRDASDDALWTQHKFVWREAGAAIYRGLIGATLAPPLWDVRYAMFEGDVAARAEEWRITIEPSGKVRQVRHLLPEARPGARLAKDAALALAERHVREHFAADPATLKLVAADERDRPARTDWAFVFADPRVNVGKDGEARMAVTLAGDEVVGAGRYVYVPETWLRAERERSGRVQIVKMAIALIFMLTALAALVAAVRSWMRGHYDARALAIVFAVALGGSAAGVAVMWPSVTMTWSTTDPILWQALLAVARALLAAMFAALVISLAAGVGFWAARTAPNVPPAGRLPPWAAGVAAAFFVAGTGAAAGSLVAPDTPLWPSSSFVSAAWPWGAAALSGLSVLTAICLGLFVLHLLDRVTAAWTRRSWVAGIVVVALIAALVAVRAGDAGAALAEGVAAGIVATAVVYYLLRFDARALPGYLVAAGLIDAAESAAVSGTRAGWVEFALVAAVSIAVGAAATRYLNRPAQLVPPAQTSPGAN